VNQELSQEGLYHNAATVIGFRKATDTVLGIVLFFAEYGPALLIWVALFGLPVLMMWRRYRKTLARCSPTIHDPS
jgi:hypothetical protein